VTAGAARELARGSRVRPTIGAIPSNGTSINGCSFCVDSGSKHAKQAGDTDERLFTVAAWREASYFTDAERAALALDAAIVRC
jgi:alkylhydroperoxidase family enzyme